MVDIALILDNQRVITISSSLLIRLIFEDILFKNYDLIACKTVYWN